MDQYQYDFSVVMAVYNVKDYLREAVESLVHQTIGFSHIQLIMVDDGSKDGSGAICDEYQSKYPENVVVVHKENGGVSSARNAGLPYVKGRYLNFMDSDDRFDRDAFQKVFSFFTRHEAETDVVSVPMHFFDGETGEHIQNRKFSLGVSILNLFEIWDITNFNVTSTFIKKECVSGLLFDERLKISEDAKYMLSILMKKMKLGLVNNTVYWYRKRSGGEESAIQSSEKTIEWYIPSLKWASNWALDAAKERFGKIPKFVQYEVMYDLQWKLRQRKIPDGVLEEKEKIEYKELLISTACRIDDDVILKQRNIDIARKLFVLEKKYGKGPELRKVLGGGVLGDFELCYGNNKATLVSEMPSVLEFIEFDETNRTCTLEGYHVLCALKNEGTEPYLVINGKGIKCKRTDRKEKESYFLEEKISGVIGFKVKFPLTKCPVKITLALKTGGVLVKRKNISVGPFFPVCPDYEKAYFLSEKHRVTLKGGSLFIVQKPSAVVRTIREGQFLAEIWRENRLGGRKAVLGRLWYHCIKPFKRKNLWIVSDRIMKADDNGEALFRYLQKHCPAKTRVIFAISKDSSDYKRMSRIGPCVAAMSFRHKLMHLLCDVNISSAAETVTVNPFWGHHDALRDLLIHQKYIFLQHGVIVCNLSNWLNRYNKNITGFVTTTKREWHSIVEGDYRYSKNNVWLTGLPRHDRLYHREKNVITVMPTWRKYLMRSFDSKAGLWTVGVNFYRSRYFQFYNALISNEKLLEFLGRKGFILQFFPHPAIQPVLEQFRHDPRVRFLPLTSSYREIYAESRMVVTDYSSASYDFSYLRKPVIYCQFDKEEFFAGEHVYTRGYFDYEEDGFGEVAYDLDRTIDQIMEYVSTDCKLKDKYRKRIDDFFAFNDKDNCKRVVDKILALSEKM